jgi:hypothetical protein
MLPSHLSDRKIPFPDPVLFVKLWNFDNQVSFENRTIISFSQLRCILSATFSQRPICLFQQKHLMSISFSKCKNLLVSYSVCKTLKKTTFIATNVVGLKVINGNSRNSTSKKIFRCITRFNAISTDPNRW